MRYKAIFAMALTPFLLSAATPQKTAMKNKNEACKSPFHVMHVDVRHTESKGVGYNNGYTTLEGFGIYDHNPYFMPFLDLRGHVFNNGQLAGNVGLGERTVIPSINHIFGLYLYYDVRQEDHGLTVNQLSPGIEMLGKRMEYRINAYFPVGNDESHAYRHRFDKFDGNRIILKNRKKFAMTGADAEVGAHITQSTRHDFYFGIGPYYFTADPNNAWGGKTRLYWRYKDYVSLEASYSYDHIFKNVVQGTVAFSYPFGKKLERKGKNCPNSNDLALSRAAFAPYRFEIPVVETRKQHRTAINSATGQPWRVWFVRNTSSSNGTVESPFSTLTAAQNASGPNDMIYVFQGDGTSRGMNAGIVLKNGQSLFGSGTKQTISTSVGRISIPAQTPGAPTVTNTTGSVITLANGNEISGMNIQVLAGNGIDSPLLTGVVGANVHHNIVSGNLPHTGILLLGSGNFTATNNRVTSSDNTTNVGISLSVLDGTFATGNLSNNVVTGYTTGIRVDPSPLSPTTTASCNVTIAGNSLTGFGGQGIALLRGMANSQVRITNNTITNTLATLGGGSSSGILLGSAFGSLTGSSRYTIDNNTIVTTTSTALTSCIGINVQGTAATSARLLITNNTMVAGLATSAYGLNMDAGANGTICASISNNLVRLQTVGSNGMSISGSAGTVNIDDFSNNIAPASLISGTVRFVAPGTCGN